MPDRTGFYLSVAADAELVTGFMVKFKVLGRAVVAILAFKLEAVETVVEFHIPIICLKLHAVCSGRGERQQRDCERYVPYHRAAP